jgi:glycogen debranching enzyme
MNDFDTEWLLTNRFGGYASSTYSAMNTRTYHSLLTSASLTGGNRVQLLNSLEELVEPKDGAYYISTHRYPDAVFPEGYTTIQSCGAGPQSVWFEHKLGDFLMLRKVTFSRSSEEVRIEYSSSAEFTLRVRPLLTFRNHHCVVIGSPRYAIREHGGDILVSMEGVLPSLVMTGVRFNKNPLYYYNHTYIEEQRRGLNSVENLFSPGEFVFKGKSAVLVATVHPKVTSGEQAGTWHPVLRFVCNKGVIVAGYHWFWDWCRDSMVILPTLVRELKDPAFALQVIFRYLSGLREGFAPTGFDEITSHPFYTSVDSSLWIAYAFKRILPFLGNQEVVGRISSLLVDVYEGYVKGGPFGVKVDRGLVCHQKEGATWMDACFEGRCFTPRSGSPVEVNALWLDLLDLLSQFGPADRRQFFRDQASESTERFLETFSSPFGFYDVVGQDARGSNEIRPNMVIALAVLGKKVPNEIALRVLSVARRHLLTPYGLRTLSPSDPGYTRRYGGDRLSRDSAYHNGMVWPWLTGFLFDAGEIHDPTSLAHLARVLAPLFEFATRNYWNVPEMFEPEYPYSPRGAISQAWSVSEVLRVMNRLKELGLGVR